MLQENHFKIKEALDILGWPLIIHDSSKEDLIEIESEGYIFEEYKKDIEDFFIGNPFSFQSSITGEVKAFQTHKCIFMGKDRILLFGDKKSLSDKPYVTNTRVPKFTPDGTTTGALGRR